MTQKNEALKMAIEALEKHKDGWWLFKDEIKACKEALEEVNNAPTVEQATIVTQIDAVKFQEALDAMCEDKDKQIAELQAQVNELRKALESLIKHETPNWSDEFAWKIYRATPAQCLIQHDNEVIEKCVKVIKSFKQADPYTGEELNTEINKLLNDCIIAIKETYLK